MLNTESRDEVVYEELAVDTTDRNSQTIKTPFYQTPSGLHNGSLFYNESDFQQEEKRYPPSPLEK